VPISKNVWSYTSIPPIRLHGVALSLNKSTETNLPLIFLGGKDSRSVFLCCDAV